jgi:hypothetical protein
MVQRGQYLLLLAIGFGSGVAGCAPRLDTEAIATQIQSDLETQTNLPIDSVTCPTKVKPESGASFQCVGTLREGNPFLIEVTQADDDSETVAWEIPTSRHVINLAALERHFQDTIRADNDTQPVIDCGDTFRVNRPGDQFECRVANTIRIEQSQLEAIQVSLDSQGNINWQEIRQEIEIAEESEIVKDSEIAEESE